MLGCGYQSTGVSQILWASGAQKGSLFQACMQRPSLSQAGVLWARHPAFVCTSAPTPLAAHGMPGAHRHPPLLPLLPLLLAHHSHPLLPHPLLHPLRQVQVRAKGSMVLHRVLTRVLHRVVMLAPHRVGLAQALRTQGVPPPSRLQLLHQATPPRPPAPPHSQGEQVSLVQLLALLQVPIKLALVLAHGNRPRAPKAVVHGNSNRLYLPLSQPIATPSTPFPHPHLLHPPPLVSPPYLQHCLLQQGCLLVLHASFPLLM
jgi:hypothetical protein